MTEKYRLIRNVRFVDPDAGRTDACDFLYKIRDGRSEILKIGKNLRAGEIEGLNIVNMHGMTACTPFVDLRCTVPDPGYSYRESLSSGLLAAAAGGYGRVLLTPASSPKPDNPQTLDAAIKAAAAVDLAGASFGVPLTKGGKGAMLTDFRAMKKAGAGAVCCDWEEKESGAQILLDGVTGAAEAGLLFEAPVGKKSLAQKKNAGRIADHLGGRTPDRVGELLALGDALTLSRVTGCPLHFPLVTQKESVDMMRRAKSEGLRVSCGTAPQYFAFSDSELLFSGSRAKFDPPLRREEDRLAVIEGLKDGTVDCICTDHTPLSDAEKGADFGRALPGGTGLDTAFAAGVTHLVLPGHLSVSELLALMSTAPARILGSPWKTAVGGRLDLVFFDADEEMLYVKSTMRSRSVNTPFYGRALRGRVKALYFDGDRKY